LLAWQKKAEEIFFVSHEHKLPTAASSIEDYPAASCKESSP